MVDINTSPHSEYQIKVQRLYEAARDLIVAVNLDGSKAVHYQNLENALSAFDGEAFEEVKS